MPVHKHSLRLDEAHLGVGEGLGHRRLSIGPASDGVERSAARRKPCPVLDRRGRQVGSLPMKPVSSLNAMAVTFGAGFSP